MAAVVRCFYFSGLATAPVSAGTRFATDSVGLLSYPYISAANVTANTGTAQSLAAAPAKTGVALIQVQSGKSVHIEVNHAARSETATTSSPIFRGDQIVICGPGWSFSVLEAS